MSFLKLLLACLLVISFTVSAYSQESLWRELTSKYKSLYYQGRYQDAENTALEAAKAAERTFGPEHPNLVQTLIDLAYIYKIQRKYSQAEAVFKRIVAIREKTLPSGHPDLVKSLKDLADIYKAQGKSAEAAAVEGRLKGMSGSSSSGMHGQSQSSPPPSWSGIKEASDSSAREQASASKIEKAQSLLKKAELCRSEGRSFEAESYYREALAEAENAYGQYNPNVLQYLNALADFYLFQIKYNDAEACCRRAVAIMEKNYGTESPSITQSLNNLAVVYGAQNNYSEVESVYARVLSIMEKNYSPDNANVRTAATNLAYAYNAQFKHSDSIDLYRRILSKCKQLYGSDDIRLVPVLRWAASFFRVMGRLDEAQELEDRSRNIQEKQ